MFHSSSQASIHLPLATASVEETQLPRGECGFVLVESKGSQGTPQRCPCRTFYPDSLVRSHCGCGHQAWHHEAQPLATVSMDEFLHAVEQTKRLKQEVEQLASLSHDLKQELLRERLAREELVRTNTAIQARMYENMQYLKMAMDDRVEAVVDRTTELSDLIKAHGERLTMVDEFSMDLENRVDRVEQRREQRSGMSRDVTPVGSTPKQSRSTPTTSPVPLLPLPMQSQQQSPGQLPIRIDQINSLSWCVRVVFVPRKSLRVAYDPDHNGYKRCASRNLRQDVEFPGQDSACFTKGVETAFKDLLRGRPWMPMTAHRPVDEPFGCIALTNLPPHLIRRDVWDYSFLDHHCIAHDKMQGDILYITLQYEEVAWNEIKFLSATKNVDESCWDYDEELDGAAKYKSLDSEMMHNSQDPPPTYSSQTHSMADKALSKLYVLADSAAMLNPVERAPTQSSSHSSHSRFSTERNSLRSFENETTDDDHRNKKPKLRSKQSIPNDNSNGQSQHPMYVSGRSKRKMPVREKGAREPLHFSVTNVTKWRPNLLHSYSSKGKEAAHNP